MSRFTWLAIVLYGLLAAGCDVGPKSAAGFSLPDGDPEKGKAVFVALECNSCHRIPGVEQLSPNGDPEISVALGGKTTRIKSYGDLVTSIINPSHRLARGYPEEMVQVEGKSRMRNYNDIMTVSQLIDLVAFVQSTYELQVYVPSHYPNYYPGVY